MINWAVVIT